VSHRGPAEAGHYILAAVALLLAAASASAQSTPSTADPTVEFLPRSAFHMTAEHVSGSDDRFVWDTNFGGDIDFLDYGAGRVTFAGNYQAILGREFRDFDPNQGNYTLEGSTSLRVHGVEAAAVFHHISRHLSDRPKRFAIDWNMLGGRVEKAGSVGTTRMEARVDLRKVTLASYVDYSWELEGGVRTVYRADRPVAPLSDVRLRLLGTDGSQNRGTQTGFRAEGGVHVKGRGAAVELFAAVERRIDPFPLEFGADTWAGVGFRLLSR
jgi:hypothetical protein